MTPLKVLQRLLETRDQIHILHWNTKSDPEHRRFNEFYDSWLDLTDKFIETYQGKYGRIEGVCSIIVSTAQNCQPYFVNLMIFLNGEIQSIIDPKTDSDLENIIADMKQLVNHTIYLLTLG